MDNKDGYLFRLIIRPKELNHSKDRNWVTELLQLEPTGGHELGDITTAAKYNSAKQYDYWSWEYGLEWQKYWTENGKPSFSENLFGFLQSLPSSKMIWDQLNNHCECSLYIPVERSNFLIEMEFESDIWEELLKRNLKLQISALSKHGKN